MNNNLFWLDSIPVNGKLFWWNVLTGNNNHSYRIHPTNSKSCNHRTHRWKHYFSTNPAYPSYSNFCVCDSRGTLFPSNKRRLIWFDLNSFSLPFSFVSKHHPPRHSAILRSWPETYFNLQTRSWLNFSIWLWGGMGEMMASTLAPHPLLLVKVWVFDVAV